MHRFFSSAQQDRSKYEDACPAFKEAVAAGLPNPPSPKARGGPVRKRRSEVPEQPPTRKHRKLSSADTDVTSSSSEATVSVKIELQPVAFVPV